MSDDLWKDQENILYWVEYLLIIFLKKSREGVESVVRTLEIELDFISLG